MVWNSIFLPANECVLDRSTQRMTLVFILVGVFLCRYEFVASGNAASISIFAEAMLDLALLFVFLMIGGHYLRLIESVPKARVKSIHYLILGILSLSWITFYDLIILSDTVLTLLFFSFVLLWGIYGKRLCIALTDRFPLKERDKKLIFRTYPPRKRTDLIIYDMLILFVLIMPFISRTIFG